LEFSDKKREKLTEEGKAMPHGGYPIRNRADLHRAIQAFGRARNKVTTKAWIIKRARELNAVEMLPEGWVKETAAAHGGTMTGEEVLAHYGVRGMKWGVRRSAAERRASRGDRKSEDYKETVSLRGKRSSELSNNQLKKVNERLNLEQNYHRLNPSTMKRGHDAVKGVLAVAATATAAYTFVTSPLGQKMVEAGRNVIKK
jgi:hypothetical protein